MKLKDMIGKTVIIKEIHYEEMLLEEDNAGISGTLYKVVSVQHEGIASLEFYELKPQVVE